MRALRLGSAVIGLSILLLCLSQRTQGQSTRSEPVADDECFTFEFYCDVEGYAALLVTADGDVDSYVATYINDDDLLYEGYEAYVEGYLYAGDEEIDDTYGFDDGDGTAASEMLDVASSGQVYTLFGEHYLLDDNECDPDFGDLIPLGETAVQDAGPPTILSLSQNYGYVGTSGQVTITGTNLVDPISGAVSVTLNTGTGMTITVDSSSPDGSEIQISYTIAQNASTGPRLFVVTTDFGQDVGGDQQFTVGDPTPVILSVSPGLWQAGQTNLAVTVNGQGFGTNPILGIAGTGVSFSQGTSTDTQIAATVTIASSAPNQNASVTVQSQGYNGTFVPANDNSASSNSYSVPVQATPGPVPQIQLYGQTITTTQSVVVGQQIALSAIVNLPQGVSISTQQWSLPPGVLIGGYNASTSGGGCVVLIAGESSQAGACTGNPVSTSTSSFSFYWIDSGGTSRQITYSYTASNGSQNSATATFNVGAPTGSNVTTSVGTVSKIFSGGVAYAQLTNSPLHSAVGIFFSQSATPPTGNAGSFSWVQLINSDNTALQANTNSSLTPGPHSCVPSTFSGNSAAELDTSYPYPNNANTTNDSPGEGLVSSNGEEARVFSATMFSLWSPTAISACNNGSSCTIPVPLGSVSWKYSSDYINTLNPGVSFPSPFIQHSQNETGSPTFVASNPGTAANYSYPTWTQVDVSGIPEVTCQ
jgi:hypothetical protein